MKSIVASVVLLIFYFISIAQSYNFHHLTIDDGLPVSAVYSIRQDKRGNIWFGTFGGGVSRYDGKTITNFSLKDGLPDNSVSAIEEDKQGNIWFGARNNHLARYDGKTFTAFSFRDSVLSKDQWCIKKDNNGNLWFGNYAGSIMKYDGEKLVNYPLDTRNNTVHSMLFDSKENIWVGVGLGVLKIEMSELSILDANKKSSVQLTASYEFPLRKVSSMIEDLHGNIWFASDTGLIKCNGRETTFFTYENGIALKSVRTLVLDKKGNIWMNILGEGLIVYDGETFKNITTKQGLPTNFIYTLFIDREENIWMGSTDMGVIKYSGNKFIHYSQKDGLVSNSVYSIFRDSRNVLWVGTKTSGVVMFDFSHNGINKFSNYASKDGFANYIVAITEDTQGNMWFGTNRNGAYQLDARSIQSKKLAFKHINLPDKRVWNICVDSKNNIWFAQIGSANLGTMTGGIGVVKFDGNEFIPLGMMDGLIDGWVNYIIEDSQHNMWFAGNRVLSKWDNKQFVNYISITTGAHKKNTPFENGILSVQEDKLGGIWVATSGGGIFLLKKEELGKHPDREPKPIWESFTTIDGLINDAVESITFDKSGNLWIGTDKGICKLDVNTYYQTGKKNFRCFGKEEGFIGTECIQNSIFVDHDSSVWFGTSKCLTRYNPSEDKINDLAPQTNIIGIRLFFEKTNWAEYADSVSAWYNLPHSLNLPHAQNHLTFDFIGISHTLPEKVRYQYKLDGLDHDWSPVTAKNEAVYSNIPPGEYTFLVKAANNDGIWNTDPVSFSFAIMPPFYKTWWFYSVCTVLILALFFLYVKFRERNFKRQQVFLESEVEKRTLELKNEKLVAESQRNIVEKQRNNIVSSINYAKTIQDAMLIKEDDLKKMIPFDFFIFYRPRDIVSGDFYWFSKQNNQYYIAAVDCTGHGVPGALMSMMGHSMLNEIVNETGVSTSADLLQRLDARVIKNLQQDRPGIQSLDGMDMALCSINIDKKELCFSGAMNSLYMIRNGKLEIIKGESFSVGGKTYKKFKDQPKLFNNIYLPISTGVSVYLLTDGYADQFGGTGRTKLGRSRVCNLLLDIFEKDMSVQKTLIGGGIDEWKGNNSQIDDMLIVGMRF